MSDSDCCGTKTIGKVGMIEFFLANNPNISHELFQSDLG